MSLIHWWPLNGDTKDYGTANAPLVNNGATIDSSGKIGKTYRYNGAYMVTDNTTLSTSTPNLSIAGWVYLNSGSYAYIFSCRQGTGGPGLFISLETGTSIFDDGTRWSTNYYIPLNTWVHFVFTRDSSGKKLYINGALHSQTSTLGNMASIHNKIYIGRNYYNDTASTASDVKINDLRIYDHALSAKEVKELSKGLVLHYDFEDGEIESTTNLCGRQYHDSTAGSDWGGHHTVCTTTTFSNAPIQVGNHIEMTYSGSGGGGFGTYCCTIAVSPSTTYCYSLYIRSSDNLSYYTPNFLYQYQYGANGYITEYGLYSPDYREKLENGWYRIWRTITTNASATEIRLYFFTYPEKAVTYDIGGLQFEQKDHMTPYINGTRQAGKVYDCSGYGYDGTVNGDLQIVSDSICGKHSALFGSNIYIEPPLLPEFYQATYSFWVKLNGNGQAYRSIFIPKNSPTGYGIWLSLNTEGYGLWAYQSSNSPSYCKFGSFLSDGTWYLCTHVFNNGVGQWYLNGQPVAGTTAYTSRNYIGGAVHTIGDSYTGSSWDGTPFNGKIADFKIYATALSATDVLAEYNRKASIDKTGNLFTGKIVEETGVSPKIEKANYVKASSFSDGLMTKTLDDGAVFERIYYFDYDKAGGVWTTATAKSCNTTGKFSVLGSLNSYVPEDGWYEFYYREGSSWVRWKQSYNPLSRVTSGSSGSSSEYTYIGGSSAPYSGFYGLTRYSSNDSNTCYLRGAPSWWCCIAPYGTDYDVFPDMWGNSTNNHHQELWIRIDNIKAAPEFKDTKFKLNKTGVMTNNIIEN